MSAKETIKRIVDSFNSKPHLKDKTREMGEGLMLGASLADDANELSKDVQAQVDQLVVEGDSSVEAAQARVDASGRAYTTLKKRLDEKEQETTAQFQQTKRNISITPDDFTGLTDSEKITNAYAFALENKIPNIRLNRTYDLTGGSVFLPEGDWIGEVGFIDGHLVKYDSGYMFTRASTSNGINSPMFHHVRFTGDPEGKTIISDGDKMIRHAFYSCYFKYISGIKTTKYTQSLRIINCEGSLFTSPFIESPHNLDTVIDGGRMESSMEPLIEALSTELTSYACTNLRINNCVIEGYTQKCPIRLSSAIGLDISRNYFEKNMHDIELVQTTGLKNVIGNIKLNSFWGAMKDLNISIAIGLNIDRMRIEDNTSNMQLSDTKALMNRMPGYYENNYMLGGNVFLKSLLVQPQDINLKANRSLEPFISGTTLNGWSGKVEYAKNDLGQVLFKAKLTAGTVSGSTALCLIPSGYRPFVRVFFGGFNVTKGLALSDMFIHTNGNIYLNTSSVNVSTGDSIEFSFIIYTEQGGTS
ncbi:hypothetical protein [Carnobacterium antarcticum]|uniref:Uncharacterized protein n=1 Tax=Carnobacterium antarcticum TaxID=2126436 RepID=A0ABW4NLN8_9LACT|nr:hypothetical protein [Carnobacterium sp. CP1]ALV21069.1 hypothetical protein NY10_449 [Carnobacterium sp. CP1]